MIRSFRLYRFQHRYAPYLFVAPFALTFAVFGLYPLIKSLVLAFYITAGPTSSKFVGWGNFRVLWADPDFHKAVWNTAVFAFFSVFLQLPLSLGLALLLNRKALRGRNFFRLVFFSPNLVGSVFVAVLFTVIFMPKFGLLNQVLHASVGLPLDTKWLSNPSLVMPALVATSLWMYVGFNMIYFLAALQTVDGQLYEAAQVDGANRLQQFVHVTIPGIKPVAVFVTIMSAIGSFQLFELPYVMLNGTSGPNQSGLTIVMYLFNTGFSTGDLGYACAIGWALVLIILTISLIQARLMGLWRRDA
jgi:ABC-type sugar transport system permease subunit